MILRPGVRAPDFCVPDQFGSTLHLAEVLRRSTLILVFFPFAFSPVCGDEIRALDELQTELVGSGDPIEIIAMTADSKYTLAAWAQARDVSVNLGSDFWPHGQVARSYGVFDAEHGVAERGVFVISRAGTIESSRQAARAEARDFTADIGSARASM
ncbi:redoxin domain-containing protein [Brevibacterium marinum]|uniref:Peroxiredoxin n=1 Tax=Brevibacterium marinum TaxID=418643 RepID=A0A846S0Y3_9MICO|nr:redoxin domain-containing protein [Brevibacterium marinum]NJC57345.1 peroxiredoxin [Brevibacterium marinum]